MKIGMIGLGKLGLPVATAMAMKGADVMGYDLNQSRMSYAPQPYQETGPDGKDDFNDYLDGMGKITNPPNVPMYMPYWASEANWRGGKLRFGPPSNIAEHADLIFIAVQTPHDSRFEGATILRDIPQDFDYEYLRKAVMDIVPHITRPTTLVIISTCLPGTLRRELKPLLTDGINLVYNPSFIAMGTTMRDFLDPEFILLGADDTEKGAVVQAFYAELLGPGHPPIHLMSIESAELSKVAYNTAISQKIVLANTLMEICHKTPGANVDAVTNALKSAYRRVTGSQYMDGGMGDGGGCHPRDNIAMSYLAKKLTLAHDPFMAVTKGREGQTWWLALQAMGEAERIKASHIIIAGYAYKPGTNITTGSPALLLKDILDMSLVNSGVEVVLHDPHVTGDGNWADACIWGASPVVVFLGCKHDDLMEQTWESLPQGSVVIDPFRSSKCPYAWRLGVGKERFVMDDADAGQLDKGALA